MEDNKENQDNQDKTSGITEIDRVVFGLSKATKKNVDMATLERAQLWLSLVKQLESVRNVSTYVKLLAISMLGLAFAEMTLLIIILMK